MSGCADVFIVAPLKKATSLQPPASSACQLTAGGWKLAALFQLHAFERVVLRHVGQDHLAECRAANIDDVDEAFELDRAVDAQVGPRAGGQRAVHDHVDTDGAALR